MKKRLFLFMCLILMSTSLFAVDGYKNLKFGMSLSDVKKSGVCYFFERQSQDQFVKNLWCTNFYFLGKKSEATTFFIDDKFLRIDIIFPFKDHKLIYNSLVKKYGKPISVPSKETKNLYNTSNESIELRYGFDKNTVWLRIRSQYNRESISCLTYESSSYDKLFNKNLKKSRSNVDDL